MGQGDSLLLITPDGKTLLVDGGGFGGGPRQLRRTSTLARKLFLRRSGRRGIRHLDVVALSHAHADHMGGLPASCATFSRTSYGWATIQHVDAYKALLDEAMQIACSGSEAASRRRASAG